MKRVQNNKRRRCRQYFEITPGIGYLLTTALSDGWYFHVSPYSPMIRRGIRWFFKISVGCSVLAMVVFLFFGGKIGHFEAQFDIWRQHYEIRTFGSYKSDEVKFSQLLNPYGIIYRQVSASVLNPFAVELVEAYNRSMKKAIRNDLGLDVESLFRLFHVLELLDDEDLETIEFVNFYQELKSPYPNQPAQDDCEPIDLMETSMPGENSDDYYKLSDCYFRSKRDLDGDAIKEELCIRELQFKERDRHFTKKSVVLHLFKKGKKVLQQELRLDHYYQETFLKIADIDNDGRIELVTLVKLGPDCAGCSALRVYRFERDRFERVVSIFDADIYNPAVVKSLKYLPVLKDQVLEHYQRRTGVEHPCGFDLNCMASELWLTDSDRDGVLECIFLTEQPYRDHSEYGRHINIVIAEILPNGQMTIGKVYTTGIGCCDGFVNLLGFLKTGKNRLHLLVDVAWGGTGIVYPLLHIYDLSQDGLRQVGELGGFYENVISERLVDLDGDGTTEIIYVEDGYWPPGGSHAEVIPIYGIAAYLDGKYREVNQNFNHTYQKLNQFWQSESF